MGIAHTGTPRQDTGRVILNYRSLLTESSLISTDMISGTPPISTTFLDFQPNENPSKETRAITMSSPSGDAIGQKTPVQRRSNHPPTPCPHRAQDYDALSAVLHCGENFPRKAFATWALPFGRTRRTGRRGPKAARSRKERVTRNL